MSRKMAPGKWSPEERDESRGMLLKAGVGLIVAGSALTYLLALPVLAGEVTMWRALIALGPGGMCILLGILALLRSAGFDLLPIAKYIADRWGKDAPNVKDEDGG